MEIGIDVDRDGETDVAIDTDADAGIGDISTDSSNACLENSMAPRTWWATTHRVIRVGNGW